MDKSLPGLDPYHDGLMHLAGVYADGYRKDGRVWIGTFLKFKSIRSVCRAIILRLKRTGEYDLLTADFSDYCKRFDTDRELLNDMLKLIYYLTKT